MQQRFPQLWKTQGLLLLTWAVLERTVPLLSHRQLQVHLEAMARAEELEVLVALALARHTWRG